MQNALRFVFVFASGLLILAAILLGYASLKDASLAPPIQLASVMLLRLQIAAFAGWALLYVLHAPRLQVFSAEGVYSTPSAFANLLIRLVAALLVIATTCMVYGLALSDSDGLEVGTTLIKALIIISPAAFLSVLFFTFGDHLIDSLKAQGAPSLEKNWSSLGGGSQGWRLSLSLTYLLLFLSVSGLFGIALDAAIEATAELKLPDRYKSENRAAQVPARGLEPKHLQTTQPKQPEDGKPPSIEASQSNPSAETK